MFIVILEIFEGDRAFNILRLVLVRVIMGMVGVGAVDLFILLRFTNWILALEFRLLHSVQINLIKNYSN